MLPKFKAAYNEIRSKYITETKKEDNADILKGLAASTVDHNIGQMAVINADVDPELTKENPKCARGMRGEIASAYDKDGIRWYTLKFADGKTLDVPGNILEINAVTASPATSSRPVVVVQNNT